MEQYTYVATCLFGLEHSVGEEIDALGYERIETIDGRVTFRGDLSAAARCNLWLRTAERLFLLLGKCQAPTFDALFEGTKAMPWESFIGPDDAFPVSGHAVRSALFSIPDCQKIVKKAIVDRLSPIYGQTWFSEEGVRHPIEFFILNDEASLMLDLSGTALHKRGYRPRAGAAPLRETLAAAVAKIARPREDVLFWDPFCGTGTIPIEAALLMTNTAPGLFRQFAAEEYDDIPRDLFRLAREEAADLRRPDTAFRARATDIDPAMKELAEATVRAAGMERYVAVECRDALTIETGGVRGTIACNPPYGERLLSKAEAAELYRRMGKHFAALDRWQIYILSSEDTFERLYGRRADKTRRLYNGMLRCNLYQYFKNPDLTGKNDRKGRNLR